MSGKTGSFDPTIHLVYSGVIDGDFLILELQGEDEAIVGSEDYSRITDMLIVKIYKESE